MSPKKFNPISVIPLLVLVAVLFGWWRRLHPVPLLATLQLKPAGFKVISNGKGFASGSIFTIYEGSDSDFASFYNQLPARGQPYRYDMSMNPANYRMFVMGGESQFPPYNPQLYCGQFALNDANGTRYFCRFVKDSDGEKVRLYIMGVR